MRDSQCEFQTGPRKLWIVFNEEAPRWIVVAAVPQCVELGRQIIEEEGDAVRLMRHRRAFKHARISSLMRKAADAGVDLSTDADLSLLDDEELSLVKRAAQYPRVLEGAALAHEPHRIAFYLYDLAAEFHALWNRGNDDPGRRFLIENNPQLSRARLELALGIAQIIRSGLDLMGVAATEEMR